MLVISGSAVGIAVNLAKDRMLCMQVLSAAVSNGLEGKQYSTCMCVIEAPARGLYNQILIWLILFATCRIFCLQTCGEMEVLV